MHAKSEGVRHKETKLLFVACVAFVLCAAAVVASPAQTFTILYDFGGSDGTWPESPLVQGTDGNLYATTNLGGLYGLCPGGSFNGCGTIFKISTTGTLTSLYSFCSQNNCPDGYLPYPGLVQAINGDFYGMTTAGGANGYGTVFKLTSSGRLTTLYSFCSQANCSDGAYPEGTLIQASDGGFYGTTVSGGSNDGGAVFKITAAGKLTTLYSFCAKTNCGDGSRPWAGLAQAANGDLYGTTYQGGTGNYGTVYKITRAGTLTTLHSFDSTDGAYPYEALVQAPDGNFFGTTYKGGPTTTARCSKSPRRVR